MPLNETHDPALTSWVTSANAPGCDFTIQNLPYGAFRYAGAQGCGADAQGLEGDATRIGVAIGDQILDLRAAHAAGAFADTSLFTDAARDAAALLQGALLNDFMAAGTSAWSALRRALSRALRSGSSAEKKLKQALVAQRDAVMLLPARIGDYTDFFTSIHHATSVGKLFRPDNPLLPNYQYVPIAYHGRASSIGVSGQGVARPMGQIKRAGAEFADAPPVFAASARLDYELELAVWIGPANVQGRRVGMADAEQHAFGMCLLNDWSARDIQAWEYQPLGPFLAKNFASTISPWVVTMEALEPYRRAWTRASGDPQPLPYLESQDNRARGAIDITVEAYLATQTMRATDSAANSAAGNGVASAAASTPHRLSQSSFRHAYWTVAQMVAHHTSGGCNLQPGDLLGTGTQSGPTPEEAGSMLELTKGGKQPLTLASGETRNFLADGDTVTLRAYCEQAGAARVGFGECAGTVLPAM